MASLLSSTYMPTNVEQQIGSLSYPACPSRACPPGSSSVLCAQDALEQQGLSCVLGARLAVLRSSVLPPPRRIPGGLVSGFSMQHRVPIHYGGIFLFFLLFRCMHCVLIHVWRYHACPLSGTLARRWCSRLTATADDEPRMLHPGCYVNA